MTFLWQMETELKTLLAVFAMCVLGTVSASGQSLGLAAANGQPSMIQMPEHPQQASQTGMAQERDILEHSTILYARGERPLWEVMPETPTTPLGDLARVLRQAHANVPKAIVVWKN